jgi:hypothetical protein
MNLSIAFLANVKKYIWYESSGMMSYCLSCFLQTAGNPAAPESEGASGVKDTGTDVNTEDKDVSAEDNHGEVQKPDVPADR